MRKSVGTLVSLILTTVQVAGAQVAPAQAVRESLRAAELAASRSAFSGDIATAIVGAADSSIVLLYEGAPIVRGRASVERLLKAQPSLRNVRLSWEPLRVLVSQDGLFGSTFGATFRVAGSDAPVSGRYISVWQRSAVTDPWRLVAHVQIGLFPPRDYVPATSTPTGRTYPNPSIPVAAADLAFAKRAGEAGAPTAFAEYVAPDGMMFGAGGELTVGAANVRARMLESRAATARWEWQPVFAVAAKSGDLGATVGEAIIRSAEGGEPSYSKYVTIWQRQADGSLKFVVDGGNSRPATP
jgi:ketosteroid isomerase-like protein